MSELGKSVLVTGAGRGIGLSIAETLAMRGYGLVLLVSSDASANELRQAAFVQKSSVQVVALDLRDLNAIEGFVAGWRGSLWGIVNNAGVCKTHNIYDSSYDPLIEVLNTNLIGPYFLTKGLLGSLQRPGRIVNIASQLGLEGRAGYSAYCASKFGVIGITKCWAKELGREGITVNAVCPGWVDTDMSKNDMQRMADERGIPVDILYADICTPLELKRFNSTTEVANLVTFLLSVEASGITGRDILMQTIWNQE